MRALLTILIVLLVAPATAQTTYYCVPDEPRIAAPDRLTSVEIRLQPNGAFDAVLYRAANGATFDRGKQYDSKNSLYQGQHVWIGALRVNRNVGIVGTMYRANGRLLYVETIHDNLQGGKIVSTVRSVCEDSPPQYGGPVAPAVTPPSVSASPPIPTVEIKAFRHCIDVATIALATISNEPAQTIVDAALGECAKERQALQSALERQGITQSVDFVDGLAKEIRPNLLAEVLNVRATAARPADHPAKSESAKGQPL